MRRAATLIPLVLLAGVPASAQASAPASVKVTGCVPALAGPERSATFEARMRAVPRAARMQLRFTLQVRPAGGLGWRRVSAEGLDRWLSANAGVRRYTFAKTVQNLAAPASYRTI